MESKKGLLPVVSEHIGSALHAEILQTERNEYITDMLRRLEEDNPCIANFISQMSLGTNDPLRSLYTALLTYRLLESQAEANAMKKDLENRI